jgi:ABC-type spermidine/putrescine transport system permease subunit I
MGSVQVRVAARGAGAAAVRGRLGRSVRTVLAVPTIGWVALFFAVPLVLVLVYSFATVSLVTFNTTFGWTWSNYRQIFDHLYLDTLIRSVVLSVSATAGCLLLGFPLAYFISRQSVRRQRLLLVLVIVPFWTSFIVRTYAMENLLGQGGPVDHLARLLGAPHGLVLLYTQAGIGIGILYSYLPLMVLPIYVSLERIDAALLDAAGDLGARPRRAFWRVTVPLAAPGILVGCLIVGIPAMGEYVIPEVLGGGKTLMLGNVISEQFLSVGNTPFGSAIAVVLMAAMAVALIGLRRARKLEDA